MVGLSKRARFQGPFHMAMWKSLVCSFQGISDLINNTNLHPNNCMQLFRIEAKFVMLLLGASNKKSAKILLPWRIYCHLSVQISLNQIISELIMYLLLKARAVFSTPVFTSWFSCKLFMWLIIFPLCVKLASQSWQLIRTPLCAFVMCSFTWFLSQCL